MRSRVGPAFGVLAAAGVCIASFGGARTAPSTVMRFTTERGVRVVLRQEPESQTTALAVAVRTLDAEWRFGPGLGAVVAGALFGSNSNLSREGVERAIAFVGGGFRWERAADHICVSCVTTPAALSDAVWLVSQALKNAEMDPETTSEALRNHLSQLTRSTSEPATLATQAVREALFPGHPYGQSLLGTAETLRRIPRQKLVSYYRLAFRPENTVIAVCGNVDADRVRRSLGNQLVDFEARAVPGQNRRRAFTLPELNEGPRRGDVVAASSTAMVTAAYRTPGRLSPDYPALRVLTTLLGVGKGSRLFRSVRDSQGVGYVVGADLEAYADAGILYAFAEVAPRPDDASYLQKVEALVVGAVDGVLSKPPTEAELERARQLAAGMHRQEHQRGVERALALARAELLGGGWENDENLPARLLGVSEADVGRIAREVLANRYVVVVRPGRTNDVP